MKYILRDSNTYSTHVTQHTFLLLLPEDRKGGRKQKELESELLCAPGPLQILEDSSLHLMATVGIKVEVNGVIETSPPRPVAISRPHPPCKEAPPNANLLFLSILIAQHPTTRG